MKAIIMVMAVATLLVISSGMALAAPPTPHGRGQRNGPGPKATAGAASLEKRHAGAGVVQNRGSDAFDLVAKHGTLHVLVNGDTRFQAKGKSDATFADVVNGSKVNVLGTRDSNGNLLARRVHVVPARPSIGHAVGQVVAFTAAQGATNGSITVRERRSGQDRVFVVTSNTKIVLPEGESSIQVGNQVTVVGTKDTTPTARGIAVHGTDNQDENED